MKHKVEFLHHRDNPNADAAWEMITGVARGVTPEFEIKRVYVDFDSGARCCEGDMQLLVDGVKVRDAATGPPVPGNFVCTDIGGLPPCWALEAELLRAMSPRGLLFMCVANSARSQIAEGIARSIAPHEVKIFSAGSTPTKLREEAITVLADIGIDISGQYAKAANAIPADQVDAVVTLCSEEVCPVWLHPAVRVHWGLPDPASVTGPQRLQAFRNTRDELMLRLQRIF